MTPQQHSSETRRLLDERYGAPSPSRRRTAVVVLSVLVVLALGWLLWVAWAAADPDVEALVATWEVTSEHAVEVELVVHRDSGDAATCTIIAQASDASVVGETEVELAAGEAGEQRLTVTVRTEREATAVRLGGCD